MPAKVTTKAKPKAKAKATTKAKARAKPAGTASAAEALAWLKQHGTQKAIDDMARYGIPSDKALGVTVGATKAYSKQVGKSQALAEALWKSGWYEARMLAAFVGEPEVLTVRQMDAWANEFDSWAIVDTVCFHLFDKTELGWGRVHAWATANAEFKKRAAFALLWALSVHDKTAPDATFLACLPLIERAAEDERDYVKKGVDMALRAVGKRNPVLRAAAEKLARKLAASTVGAQAWVGRHALAELASAKVKARASRKT